MKHKTLLTVTLLLGALALLIAPASASHWQPGDGNPAAAAENVHDSFDSGVFADDWSPVSEESDETSQDDDGSSSSGDDQDSSSSDEAEESDEETDETDDVFSTGVFADDWAETLLAERFGSDDTSDEDDETGEDPSDDSSNTDGETGDDSDDSTDDSTDADDGTSDDGPVDGVTEERHVTPAPEPSAVGEDWISYPNPRDIMPYPSTAGYDPSIKICAVMLNQENEVITGYTVPDTVISIDTDIPYGAAQPVVFDLPIDQTQDFVGEDPSYIEGDGMLDAECGEYHNIPEGDYTYGEPSITGADSDQVEFVGVTEYWDATDRGDPFNQRVHNFGDNELSDGYIPPLEAGNYEQQHAEVVYLFRLK